MLALAYKRVTRMNGIEVLFRIQLRFSVPVIQCVTRLVKTDPLDRWPVSLSRVGSSSRSGVWGPHLPPASIAAEGVRLGVMEELEESLDQSQVSEDSVIGMTVFGEQMLQFSDPSHYRVDERTAGSGLAFLATRARDDQPVGNAPSSSPLKFWMSRESGKTNVGPKWLVGTGLAALYTSLKARHDLLGNVAVNFLV